MASNFIVSPVHPLTAEYPADVIIGKMFRGDASKGRRRKKLPHAGVRVFDT
jgi:hypothetical protein